MIQTSVASLRWLSPSARNSYRLQIGIVIGFVGMRTYAFDAVFKTNNADLIQLVEQKKARYAVHIECLQTRYRNIFTSDKEKFSFEIAAGMLDGRVEVCSFILAAKPMDKYRNESFHPDYTKLTFRVRKGDTLAVGHDREFPADKKSDPLRKVPSIFSIVPSDDAEATAMDVDTSGAKVVVTLSRKNYDAYNSLKSDQSLHPMLSAVVVVPALVAVIDEIRHAATDGGLDDYAGRRWFMVVSRRLREIGIDPANAESFVDSSLKIAHELVGQPLSASLEGLKTILQDTE
ncbi:MAG: hypothetical protein ABIZ80_24095 [Bryobacteraceae bacterium]